MFGLLTHDLKDEKYNCSSIKEKIMISMIISIVNKDLTINRIVPDAIKLSIDFIYML